MGLIALLVCGLLPETAAPMRADEAVLPSGQRVAGTLSVHDGDLFFRAGADLLRLEQVGRVRFAPAHLPLLRSQDLHRVVLPGGQSFTGALVGLDADRLRIQPAWADKPVALPRSVIVALTHVPGRMTVFADDFENDMRTWRMQGQPTLDDRQHTSGRRSLLLDASGHSASYIVSPMVQAGRLQLNFRTDAAGALGPRWAVEADFAPALGPRRVRVEVAGRGAVHVLEAPDLDAGAPAIFRTTGWHQLAIDFADNAMVIQVDNQVLHRGPGPGGALRQVRLACVGGPAAGVINGSTWFDDFLLTRTVPELRRSVVDPGQDELLLRDGDQLFGTVLEADRRHIEFAARFGRRSLDWSEVRGIYPRRQMAPVRSSDGPHVRVVLRAAAGTEPDVIEGVVRGLDERRFSLEHPLLGNVAVDRAWIREVQWRFRGQCIALADGAHHLGQESRADLSPARPEGISLRRVFTLKDVPRFAVLSVEVASLLASGADPVITRALQRGGLRTEVVLNGRVVDNLNRHVERAVTEPQRLRLELPRAALRIGDNVLELRQTFDKELARYGNCILADPVLEIPR